MNSPIEAHRRAGLVMWAGLATAALLLVVLLAQGWGSDACGAAAGLLLLVCIAVCVWAAVVGERSARAVRDEIARLATARHQDVQPLGEGNRPHDSPQGHRRNA
jgi:hypothetical protein